jgi:hypothetical protein
MAISSAFFKIFNAIHLLVDLLRANLTLPKDPKYKINQIFNL